MALALDLQLRGCLHGLTLDTVDVSSLPVHDE
jgi:hypothetical protein